MAQKLWECRQFCPPRVFAGTCTAVSLDELKLTERRGTSCGEAILWHRSPAVNGILLWPYLCIVDRPINGIALASAFSKTSFCFFGLWLLRFQYFYNFNYSSNTTARGWLYPWWPWPGNVLDVAVALLPSAIDRHEPQTFPHPQS